MIGRDGGDGGSLDVCFDFGARKSLSRREERRREIAIKKRGSMVISERGCGRVGELSDLFREGGYL